MTATESNLLSQADTMSESMLVRLSDWELAYLRVAMVHQLEEALESTLVDHQSDSTAERSRAVRQGLDLVGVSVSEDVL